MNLYQPGVVANWSGSPEVFDTLAHDFGGAVKAQPGRSGILPWHNPNVTIIGGGSKAVGISATGQSPNVT